MRKIWLVFKREYLTRLRTKGFIISTVGLPLFSVGVFAISLGLATLRTDHPLKIAILDNLGGLTPQITAALKEKLPDGQPLYQIVGTWDRPAAGQRVQLDLSEQVREGHLDGFLLVPPDVLQEKKGATYHSRNPGDYQTSRALSRAFNRAIVARRLSDRGIHVDNLSEVMRSVELSVVRVTKTGESEESDEGLLVQISVVMVLYITLMVYGVMTMRSVLEEKTTRIVEILASSVKATHLLTGKILGVAAVGLTQYLIWTLTAAFVSTYGRTVSSVLAPGASPPAFHLPLPLLIYPLIFFLAGYFLYASFYAALGAMVSSDEDLQQVQLPFTLMLVVSFILYPIILRDPNSPLSVALTLIPFFAPILMVFRITVQTPPLWQIVLSLAICVATTVAVIRLSARIYRVGILMYGKRPSVVELLRWLRYT